MSPEPRRRREQAAPKPLAEILTTHLAGHVDPAIIQSLQAELEAAAAFIQAETQIATLAAVEAQLGLAAKRYDAAGKTDPLVMRGFRAAHDRVTHLHGTCQVYLQIGLLSHISNDIEGKP